MSSGCSGSWSSERLRETAARRAQHAEMAALREEAAALQRHATALRRIAPDAAVSIELPAADANATSAELLRHADRLRAAIADARQRLECQVSTAFARRLRQNLPSPESRERPGRTVTREISTARKALTDNLSRCDPADVEHLERLALALGESGLPGVRTLVQRMAASVDRRQRARQAATSRERIRVLVTDVLPEERGTFLELLASVPDPDLPTLANRAQAAVARADRHRLRAQIARTAAEALQSLGGAVGAGLASLLAVTEAAIVPMREFPGYGLRISLSSNSLQALVVRHASLADGGDRAVQQTVSDRMDQAWAILLQAGVAATERHRAAVAEPVLVVSEQQWAVECHEVRAGRL
jgi:hypothetical protein